MNRKGKMVYCNETFQIFPSAKVAAEHHNMKYHILQNHLGGITKTARGMHFVYIENTADLSQFFTSKRREEKEREEMRKAAEQRMNELTAAQQEIAKQLAEVRKSMRRL